MSVQEPCCQSAKQQAALAESSNPISIKTNQGLSFIHPPWVNAPSNSCLARHMLGVSYEESGRYVSLATSSEGGQNTKCVCVHIPCTLITHRCEEVCFYGSIAEVYTPVKVLGWERHLCWVTRLRIIILSQAWYSKLRKPPPAHFKVTLNPSTL